MELTGFDQSNCVINPPPGVSPEECQPASAWVGLNEDGRKICITCWKMTEAELEEIKRTGRVWLLVWGNTMPPAALLGHNLFRSRLVQDEGQE